MTTITIIQIIFALLLIGLILLQKSQEGIEGALGGGFQMASVKQKRRGFEKFIFGATIICTLLFIASIIFSLIPPTL